VSDRRASIRWSLRFNVALLVIGVVVAPLLLVAAWLGVERQMESAMRRNAAFTVEDALRALDAGPALVATAAPGSLGVAQAESAVARVARLHRARIRLFDGQGQLLEDANFDNGRDLSERAGGVMLGRGSERVDETDTARDASELAEQLRQVIARGAAEGCTDSAATGSVVCYAAKARLRGAELQVLHVQDSAERPLPLLYSLRFQLGRITLVVLPFALILALWVGSRLVGPLEALRDQVLGKVRETRPVANLEAPANNETAQLAHAFNTLLTRLDERRLANEAFVADLVHEFKNPVATIRACGESLASSDVTPERAQRLARLVHESTSRLDALVSQFLELARAEAGMLQEPWEELDLVALSRARVERAQSDERWSRVRFEHSADAPARVRGVAERLETVVDNLLANAASFAHADGLVRLTLHSHDGRVDIAVSDDGPGIVQEDLPHVFERFFTTRRHDKGTGLGLALVRAIVEAHGGQVSVRSEPGRGATFVASFQALP
jgi:signal transduction histidine kinase